MTAKKTIKISAGTIAATNKLHRAINNEAHARPRPFPAAYEWNLTNHPERLTDNERKAGEAWLAAKAERVEADREFCSLPEIIGLSRAIMNAEGRASARTITAYEVVRYLDELTTIILDIPKKHMEGAWVSVDLNAQKFPRSYKYTPESTHFQAEYKGGCWRITKVYRSRCDNCLHELSLPEAARNAILERIAIVRV